MPKESKKTCVGCCPGLLGGPGAGHRPARGGSRLASHVLRSRRRASRSWAARVVRVRESSPVATTVGGGERARTRMTHADLPPRAEMIRAFMTSDQSYEGVFYTAVRTTGISCRPTRSARKPKPDNIDFCPSAEEAMAAANASTYHSRVRPALRAGRPAAIARHPPRPYPELHGPRKPTPYAVDRLFVRHVVAVTLVADALGVHVGQALGIAYAGLPPRQADRLRSDGRHPSPTGSAASPRWSISIRLSSKRSMSSSLPSTCMRVST